MIRRMPSRKTPSKQGDADTAALVLRQFRQVLNTVKTHFQQVEKKVGLGGAQVWALSVVRDQPGIGVGGLAQAMDIHQSTASNLVRSLVEKGLLEVRREGTDRRAVQLHLLPAATRLLKRVPGPFEGVLPGALRALDPATLRRLQKDLGQLIRLLDSDEKAGKIPLAEL
jgi:DNA-binding MarR family transcriptional regulator